MGTVKNLLTGRLWLYNTATGKPIRRATLADVVESRRVGGTPFAADGKWAGFTMEQSIGFDLVRGGWPKNTLAKLIGVVRW